jgi:prepilin-type N-terminal cleavage/methylation domain-containing protein
LRALTGKNRGFTIVELATVVAIVAALMALGYPIMRRARPRVELAGLGTELQSLMNRARLEAMSRGRDVSVIFYPAAVTPTGVGRILVVADEAGGFMAGAAPAGNLDYCTMTPGRPVETLNLVDLPSGVRLAAPSRTQAFPFPFSVVPAPLAGCSFCTGAVPGGGGARGAVRFDSRGRASFFGDCGVALDLPNGGSVAVTNADLSGSRVVAILPPGSVRTFAVE